jgi:hypothetical protein
MARRLISGKSGFDVFNFRVHLHNYFCKGPKINPSNISQQAKLNFNSYVHRIKSGYNIQGEELKDVMLYMYLHNPLALDDLREYGKILNMERSVDQYTYWRYNNRQLITEVGRTEAIYATATKYNKVDDALLDYVREMRESMRSS